MPNKNVIFRFTRDMHVVPYQILKLGFAMISLYAAILYIVIDMILPDVVYAYHIFQSASEYITISIVLLLIGSAWLHRLFGRQKEKSDH